MSKSKRDQCEVFDCTNFCEIKNGRNAKVNNIFVCAKHRTRWNRHKSFDVVKNERNKEFPTYSAAHKRIYVKRGLAKHSDCVDCGNTAAQWALVHTAKSLITKDGLRYSANPDDYQPMCVSCHQRYDKGVLA